MKLLSILAALVVLTACGNDDDEDGVRPPTKADMVQPVIDGDWPWPDVRSYCDPQNAGFRIWVTAHHDGGYNGSGGDVAVLPDPTCVIGEG